MERSTEYRVTAIHSNGISQETVAFTEGAYVGMAVGEHLGFLAQAASTTLIAAAMIRRKPFDRRLGLGRGLVIGIVTFLMSMEPLGGPLQGSAR